MLLMTTFSWVLVIGVPIVILLVIVGTKLKDRYY
jgi:hypothetical protein